MSERKKSIEIVFANDHARISYEIQNGVNRELAKLQTEGFSDVGPDGKLILSPIIFGEESDEKGEAALFYLDDSFDADDPSIDGEDLPIESNTKPITHFVRPTTLKVLDALQIPYTHIAEQNKK